MIRDESIFSIQTEESQWEVETLTLVPRVWVFK